MVVIARGHSSGGHSSGGHSSVVIAQCSEHSGFDSQQLVYSFSLSSPLPQTNNLSSIVLFPFSRRIKVANGMLHSSQAIGLHKDIICLGTVIWPLPPILCNSLYNLIPNPHN